MGEGQAHQGGQGRPPGKVFSRLSREITIAAKAGGGDPAMNPRLRTLLLKARDANMPADNIDRAIKKGTGELSGAVYEEITYEGYGPGGVAMIVKVATDNKNRAAADVRSVFTRFGGNLAGAGAVSFLFRHAGQFLVSKEAATEDALDGDRPRGRRRRRHHHRGRVRDPLRRPRIRPGGARAGAEGDQGRERRDRVHPDEHRAGDRRRAPGRSSSSTTPSRSWTTCSRSSRTRRWTRR
jgi:hypothetical protein